VRAEAPVTCTRCAVGYRPGLTGQRCPVCDAPVPGVVDAGRPDRDRLVLVVTVAAVLNVALLLALAVAVARAS
jgi:hypothetical protein